MPSSPRSSSSWSPPAAARLGRARSPSTGGGGGRARALTVAEKTTSWLRTADALRDITGRCSIPRGFTALLAGDLPACAPPPPGAAFVYVAAMEEERLMRLPLQPFFAAVLAHFGLAPSQLTPNAWRLLAGFAALCRRAGVAPPPPPPLTVFRHFFTAIGCPPGAWYSFRARGSASTGSLFTRLSNVTMNPWWKEQFILVSSPAPWPCPVRWGKPRKHANFPPVLTTAEKDMATKLLLARGSSLIDLTTYNSIAAAKNIIAPPPPPRTLKSERAYASVNAMMREPRPHKAPMAAAAEEGPSGHGGGGGGWPALYPACLPPPGFKKLDDDDDGHEGGWKAARQLLQGAVTARRERAFAASKPADVVAASYVAMLQAANHVAFSLGYALELEEKARARERDAGAAEAATPREELAEVKDELAEMETAVEAMRAKLAKAKSAIAAAAASAAQPEPERIKSSWGPGGARSARRRGTNTAWREEASNEM
ncbi:Os06g0174900 [Oryza sativa Japonica Group]|uniref:Os06g0174900 protein n=1 Tax=Oryza sativa subsp. japonica TaxID=39947 RepID=A0A0P0WT34_ORYSJ|nr:hypothetical protein EE612_032224 [Oryza sativa]BAS96407.1 Os06g0174900 [Oryza sativa Japonica Group]